MARGANRNGVSVAIATYDLAPHVSVATIVEQMKTLTRVLHDAHGRAVTVFGHSAGGHLAAMLAADAELQAGSRPMVAAAMPISGLFDLAPLIETPLNATLALDAASAAALSPLGLRPPQGLPVVAVVGGAESGEYLRQSRSLVERWGLAGAATELMITPGDNHFTVIAPFADPSSRLSQTLARLCRAA
jgi:arylformamidase